ncbi:septum formation initiator [Plantactinospora sp. CA-290183]|uniref:septum formation initiator n=1 Tax=Plantactinospora sp. CA-290183 TaxID=3240006 RepID=UPI003D8BBA51
MRRRTGLAVTGWLLAAGAATVTGLAAVQVIGAGLTGPAGEVRSPDEVSRALAASPGPAAPSGAAPPGPAGSGSPGTSGLGSPGPSDPGSPAPGGASASGTRRLLSTPGGTVVAECTGQRVWLASWTPAQGFRVQDVDRGPDDDAELTFRGSGRHIEVEVECPAGEPVPSWTEGDD